MVRPVGAPGVVVRHGVPCLEPYAALLWELARAEDDATALVAVDMALAAGVAGLPRPRCNWVVLGADDQAVASPDLLDPEAAVAARLVAAYARAQRHHEPRLWTAEPGRLPSW